MFSRFFIDRPIFATVLSVVITLAGAIAIFALPVTQYPEITPPTVEVSTVYPAPMPAWSPTPSRADRTAGQRRRENDVPLVAMH